MGPSSPTEGFWWRNFHDAALNRYVDQALRYNSDVLLARERVNQYQAQAQAALGDRFPTLDAGFSAGRSRSQSAATGLPVYGDLYKGSLNASYNVDIWGQYASAADGSASVEQAAAQLEVSRQNLQSVIVNRASLEADVANARAALELAEIDLQNTRIVAPRDGQLGQITVRQGGYVTAGTRLTSLVPPQHWIIANLKETQLADVKTGQRVTFTVDALNDEKFEGRVQSISPATGVEFSAITPDNATGNFVKIAQRIPVRIEVLGDADKRARLRPGMSVQVTIDTHSEEP
ncbi:HlyD family secretion protein [Cronobacter dublinensis 582]|nr:HlyD family secretion protein [Cronobacter dublinensis 582]